MKNYSALIFLFILTFVIASCDKDDDKPTKQEILMAKDWKVTEIKASGEINGAAIENFDYYSRLIDCQKDNLFQFNTGGVVIVDEGLTKCTPTAPQTHPGTWSLKENTTGDVLTINGNIFLPYGLVNTSARDLTVVSLDNQTLKVTFNESVTLQLQGFPAPITMPAKIDLTLTAQ